MLENSVSKVGTPISYSTPKSFGTPLNLNNFSNGVSSNKGEKNSNRFIPQKAISANLYQLYFSKEENLAVTPEESEEFLRNEAYRCLLQSEILSNEAEIEIEGNNKKVLASNKVLKYRNYSKKDAENFPLNFDASETISKNSYNRKYPTAPYKILDAPGLSDDFYLNLLDWSIDNVIAIGLQNTVYCWNAQNSKVNTVCEFDELTDNVCSVGWCQRNPLLAVGNYKGYVHIFDGVKGKELKRFKAHESRVGSIAWNGNLLATGCKTGGILVQDIRTHNDPVNIFQGHSQEICGLKWSFDEQYLASGGNDNCVNVWSSKMNSSLCSFSQHTAAVKALAWSPHQHNTLVTGGGTADRCIRFFNVNEGKQTRFIDTGSQVCNLIFSGNTHELVSTHGYSLNQITLWEMPSMKKMATLTGHSSRVLYLASSPCGKSIVTGAGDETLRFWNLFPGSKKRSLDSFNKASINTFDLR